MQYDKIIKRNLDKEKYYKNFSLAFLFGGLISIIGQTFMEIFMLFKIEEQTSSSLMIVCLIFIASFLTCLGIYDKIGQYAKCGTIIPITGFANSLTCAAMEGKSEGIIQGIGVNLFKLAGCVITFGVVSAYIIGGIKYLIWLV